MSNTNFVKEIAGIADDFPQWYTDVILKAQLADYSPVRGAMVIRPYGYAIWENIRHELDTRFKAAGHVNAYFPLFIPESFLKKEAEHVEGFAPECATVTRVGKEPLTEPLVVRPTSETVICDMYSKWIQSWRDLPVKINQWANVVRWEKTTRPFLRTTEFLWQEGHTAHADAQEAQDETLQMLDLYVEFCRNILAIPVLAGKKSQKEKFAGAVDTYSIEAMMLDGKSLQAGTTHFLGENFAKAFDIKYLDKNNKLTYVNQSSWGVTTRLIGALVMVHGDERGLRLPPMVAPYQAVIVPIATHKAGVLDAARNLSAKLQKAGLRVFLDERDESPGWKFNEWELKGVPCRIELGPRDLERGEISVMRRDTLEKSVIKLDADVTSPECHCEKPATKQSQQASGTVSEIKALLDKIQRDMYTRAEQHLNSNIIQARTMQEIESAVNAKKFALSMWCGDPICEKTVKEQYQATSRNMPFDQTPIAGKCVCCDKPAKYKIYFARAY